MECHGDLWNSMDFTGISWNLDSTLRILMGYRRVLMQLYGFLRDLTGFRCNLMDFKRIVWDSDETSWILIDCIGIPLNFIGLYRFSWAPGGL